MSKDMGSELEISTYADAVKIGDIGDLSVFPYDVTHYILSWLSRVELVDTMCVSKTIRALITWTFLLRLKELAVVMHQKHEDRLAAIPHAGPFGGWSPLVRVVRRITAHCLDRSRLFKRPSIEWILGVLYSIRDSDSGRVSIDWQNIDPCFILWLHHQYGLRLIDPMRWRHVPEMMLLVFKHPTLVRHGVVSYLSLHPECPVQISEQCGRGRFRT